MNSECVLDPPLRMPSNENEHVQLNMNFYEI